jgi:prepilin-type N-terminal cleavage/methylation domain-containing protein
MGKRYSQQGFTLVEIMLATTITAILMGCILAFIIQGQIMLEISKKENEVQQNLAIGINKITRELLISDQLRFIDDKLGFQPEKDGFVLTFVCNQKLVKYYVDGENELSRNFSGVGLPIASHIKTIRLVYYGITGEEINPGAPASSVTRIKIELTGGMPGVMDHTLSSAVALRTGSHN